MERLPSHSGFPAGPAGRRGFTLVELLLVMFVMAVLVSLVVGVGTYVIEQGRRDETLSKQALLMSAINAYHRVTHKYPSDRHPDSPDDPNASIDALMLYLRAEQNTGGDMAEEILEATRHHLQAIAGNEKLDAWGNMMRYYAKLGLGGKPLIVSPGPDEDFGEDDTDYRKDNIRSDTKK